MLPPAILSAALSNKEKEAGKMINGHAVASCWRKKKNRLKSNCFVLRCNDHSWLFSPLIMIKVSRGSRRGIVRETDGLLFYCDMTGRMNNKNGGRERILSEGLDWRRRCTPWLISAGEGEEGKWIQEVSVIRETKPNVQVRLRDKFCVRKKTAHLPFSL